MKLLKLFFVFFAAFGIAQFASAQCQQQATAVLLCPATGTVTAGFGVTFNTAKTGVQNGTTTSTAGQFVGIAGASTTSGSGVLIPVYTQGYLSAATGAQFDGTPVSGDCGTWSTSTGGQIHDIGSASCNEQTFIYAAGTAASGLNAAYILGHLPNAIPTNLSSSGTVADPGFGNYYVINNSSGPLTFTLVAAPAPGIQRCIWNYAGQTGILTVKAGTSGVIAYQGLNGTASTGTGILSGGAFGDELCLVSDNTNHWNATLVRGTWTNN